MPNACPAAYPHRRCFPAPDLRSPNLSHPDLIASEDPHVDDEQPVEIFLERYPSAIRDTGLRLRELIRVAVPDAAEGVRSGWSWIGYGLPDRRRRRTFAWIGPERKHIHLGFQNGALLADPDHLLSGAQE